MQRTCGPASKDAGRGCAQGSVSLSASASGELAGPRGAAASALVVEQIAAPIAAIARSDDRLLEIVGDEPADGLRAVVRSDECQHALLLAQLVVGVEQHACHADARSWMSTPSPAILIDRSINLNGGRTPVACLKRARTSQALVLHRRSNFYCCSSMSKRIPPAQSRRQFENSPILLVDCQGN